MAIATFDINLWQPKTALGKKVKSGEITNIKQILEHGKKITEAEIVDVLLPNYESKLILIGQMKGKFGGGKAREVRQTQKKTMEGSKIHFTALAVVGNYNGRVGVGAGSSTEALPAKDKALRQAKKNVIQVVRGCGSWECTCGKPHSLPYKVHGKCASVEVTLMPAPKGTGLAVDSELRKILSLAGYKDLWSSVKGQARQKINMVEACMKALKEGAQRRILKADSTKTVIGAIEG